MRSALIHLSLLLTASSAFALPQKVPSPVAVNMNIVDEVTVFYEDGKYSIEKEALFKAIGGHLQPELLEKLLRHFSDFKMIDVTATKLDQVEFKYNEITLVLEVSVAAEGKGLNVLSFGGLNPETGAGSVIGPSPFSGYFNFRGSRTFIHRSPFGDDVERPFAGNIEAVFNLLGVVLEGNASYTENGDPAWRRDDARLTWDDEDLAIRYSAGDINYPTQGFQSFRPLGGLSATRNFSIQPYRVITPSGHNEFFLKTPSQVKIYVNGRFFREIDLDAGLHNVRSLPVVRGINEIVLEIIDTFGRRQIVVFPILSEGELLADGIHQYSYNIGAPSRDIESSREYDEDTPAVSLFHRYGLTDQLTLGLNYQGDHRQSMAGAEVMIGTPIGFLAAESGYSWTDSRQEGWAYRGRYIYLGNLHNRWLSQDFGFQAEYFDREFTNLQSFSPSNPFRLNVDANVGQPLSEDWRLGLSYRYQFGWEPQEDTRVFSALLNYGGFRFHRLALEYAHSDILEGADEDRFFFTWTWTGETLGNYLSTSYNSDGHVVRTEYQHTYDLPNAQIGASLRASTSEDGKTAGAVGEYIGQRFFVLADHQQVFPEDERFDDSSQTRLDFGTAVAFTPRSMAFSRPIADSFTLVEADDSLEEFDLGVNPAGNSSLAQIGLFDTAILSNQASYIYETVRIDTRELPYGVTISGGENFVVKPTYRSGVHIRLGGSSVVYLRGRLLAANGEPVALASGEIVPIATEGESVNQTFFTNRQGYFSVEGLKGGHFRLVIYDHPEVTAEFLVPTKTYGAFSVGDIYVWEKDDE